MIKKLEYKDLLYDTDISAIGEINENTAIGQERAVEALRFGLGIRKKGYNILAVGRPGCGRTAFAKKLASEAAAKQETPGDICYVYNFRDPKKPVMLEFPPGEGSVFKNEISELIHTLGVEITEAYNDEKYESEKDALFKKIQQKRDEAVKSIGEAAKELGFSMKNSGSGLTFTPIVDGKPLSDDEFEALDEELKKSFDKGSSMIADKADDILKKTRDTESDIRKEIGDINYNIGLFTIGRFFSPIQEKYRENKKISEYIMRLKEDILSNSDIFAPSEGDDAEDIISSIIPFSSKKSPEELLQRYEVNLFIDNSALKGAPVIVSYNPSYAGLVGETEYDSEYGNYTTDFMKIMPGLFHKANGGFLILQLNDILSSPFAWETIKRVLKTGEISTEPLKDYQLSSVSITTLKPETVRFTGKVIIICSGYYYELLNAVDEDISELFKVSAFFDYEMPENENNLKRLIGYIKTFPEKNDTRPFDIGAAGEVIKYSKRLGGRRDKLTTAFYEINNIMTEADVIAGAEGSDIIRKEHIKTAVKNSRRRISIYEDKLDEMYERGEMLIDVEGRKTGQINGLSVTGAYGAEFGRPSRITATTYMGKAGLVNIEKESELSGELHTKGVQVITGYLGNTYAKDFPLCFSGRICFEQSYGGVDGDSASSAEIYAIVSSLAETPLRQDLAVTGSVNQFGEIQPIGGVTLKTEGFYKICSLKGLNGKQGVIIPLKNVDELVLDDDVTEAVRNGSFSIYAIETIDEGIELLTGEKASEVHKKAYEKLKSYYNKSIEND